MVRLELTGPGTQELTVAPGSYKGYTLLTVLVALVLLAAGAYSLLDLASFHQPQAKRFWNERQQYQAARGGIEYLLELLAAEEPDLPCRIQH